MKDALLLVSDHHGQYVPQRFAHDVDRDVVRGVSSEDWEILEIGPEHEYYWDVWDHVLTNATLVDPSGIAHYLFQDGDLWAVPVGAEDAEADTSALAWLEW